VSLLINGSVRAHDVTAFLHQLIFGITKEENQKSQENAEFDEFGMKCPKRNFSICAFIENL